MRSIPPCRPRRGRGGAVRCAVRFGEAAAWLVPAIGLVLAQPATAQTPEAVARATAENMAACREAGGRPSPTPDYHTTQDLNGDGQPDHILDLTGFDCQGAAGFFCGSAGCPLTIFASGPGGYRQAFAGRVQAWSVDRSGPRPVLVLHLHGSACGRAGAVPCEQRLAWDGRSFAALRGAPGRPPAAGSAAPGVAPPPAPAGGQWSLREVAGNPAVAVAEGPGAVQSLALLCHENRPVAALVLRARPPWSEVTVSFAAGRRRVDLPIRQTANGGNAWYAELRNSALPRFLAAEAGPARVSINGGVQGNLSLRGSTAAVRRALQGCYPF